MIIHVIVLKLRLFEANNLKAVLYRQRPHEEYSGNFDVGDKDVGVGTLMLITIFG